MLITFLILKINTVSFGLQHSGYVIGTRVRLPKSKFQLSLEKPIAQKITRNTAIAKQFPATKHTAQYWKISGMLVRRSQDRLMEFGNIAEHFVSAYKAGMST